ncbi:MAG: hypothetical protein SGARI_001050 [Bacillariaceae sp.]
MTLSHLDDSSTDRSSVLFGESVNTNPPNLSQTESREDENSMEFSVDGSMVTSELRIGVAAAGKDDDGTKNDFEKSQGEALDSVDLQDEALFKSSDAIEEDKVDSAVASAVPAESDNVAAASEERHSNDAASAQLGQFLETNKYSVLRYDTESSIATSKSPSMKDGSVLSGTGSARSSIRSVKLVPLSGNSVSSGLGIEVSGASCPASNPIVEAVAENSPAADQVFVGDVVLAVNDVDTTGWNDLNVAENQSATIESGGDSSFEDQSIKLTIMSAGSDGSATGSTSSHESIEESSCSLCIGSVGEIDI